MIRICCFEENIESVVCLKDVDTDVIIYRVQGVININIQNKPMHIALVTLQVAFSTKT